MKIIFAATILFTTLARADVTSIPILPSATDPAIKTFDSPHAIYVNRDIVVDQSTNLPPDRHQLLLWITGTGGKAQGAAVGFCNLAANLGYHVISSYPVVTETSEKQTADGKNSEWESTAHTSVIATKNADRWQQVWTYLLTETTP